MRTLADHGAYPSRRTVTAPDPAGTSFSTTGVCPTTLPFSSTCAPSGLEFSTSTPRYPLRTGRRPFVAAGAAVRAGTAVGVAPGRAAAGGAGARAAADRADGTTDAADDARGG